MIVKEPNNVIQIIAIVIMTIMEKERSRSSKNSVFKVDDIVLFRYIDRYIISYIGSGRAAAV